MHRRLRVLALLAAALWLAACSLTRLAYDNAAIAYSNATPVLTWVLGDYVELTDFQRAWVRERIGGTMAWHRARELPEYRRFFEWVLARAEDGISVDEARTAHRELRARYYRLVEHVLPDVSDFMLQLDAEQVSQLERKFAAENRKLVKETLDGTPEERSRRRARRYLEHIEEWTGRLADEQRDMVVGRVGQLSDLLDERMVDRRYRQAEILALLRAKASREQMVAGLRRLLIDTESWRNADYARKIRERDERVFELVAALSSTLTAEQRAHMQRRVNGFMRDITELSASTAGT